MVLARMAELIQESRRQMRLRWVITRHVDPTDWNTRCAMAGILIERCRKWMPPQLKRCPPEELADFIPELLQIHLGTRCLLDARSIYDILQPR